MAVFFSACFYHMFFFWVVLALVPMNMGKAVYATFCVKASNFLSRKW